jgi:hypothetical protein
MCVLRWCVLNKKLTNFSFLLCSMVLVGWLLQDPCVVSLRCAGEIYLTGPHLQKANFIYLSQSVKSSASVLFLFYIFSLSLAGSLVAQTLFLRAECMVTQECVCVALFYLYDFIHSASLEVQIGAVNKFIIDKMLLNNGGQQAHFHTSR